MATIRWCPIYPKWDIYQPLIVKLTNVLKQVITGMDWDVTHHLGVSENSVPLNPMVNDHYPY